MVGLSQGFSPATDEMPAAGCGLLAAEYDWPASELGPREHWDPAVEAVVRTLLEATAPMAYCHGPGYALVYNDSFADLLGARHPRSWGQRAALVMPEIWSRPGHAKAVDNVFAGGPSFHDDGAMLDLRGRDESNPEWAYLARSYSAVRDDEGSVLGVLVVVVEIAPVLVLVGGSEHSGEGATRWHGTELWDETVARRPLIWSGFRAGARPPAGAVSGSDQRFVADGSGQQMVLPMNGPEVRGSIGYLGMRRHLPEAQMVTLAARDQSGPVGNAPSGEFYDLFGMPDGRLALIIGHVRGAGTAAAAVMAQVKVGLRGAALNSSDPHVIFSALDDLVTHLDRSWPPAAGQEQGSAGSDRAGFGGELFVTALLGVFDPATGDLQLASAGHLPPAILRRHAAAVGRAGSGPLAEYAAIDPGPPLGIPGARPVTQIVLDEGDALIGYTKGLVQRRAQSPGAERSALLGTLNTMSATAARSISQHLVDTLIGDEGLDHDCALLVVVRDSGPHQMASVLVPPHSIAVRGARHWTCAQLESWGVNAETVATAVMCVSELVTNVVQHAGTSARVTMERADRLLVTVEDTGTWSTPHSGRQDHFASQGRGLALVSAISDAMGYARGVDGSTVWFEIALDRP
ncbi:MAG TPA: ATP-binding SpoIIE family protein phosphatase [Dermatophilaceae bacterium]